MTINLLADSGTYSVDRIDSNPAVYSANVVADLVPFTLGRLDQVQILAAVNFAEDNIPFLQFPAGQGLDCNQFPGLDLASYGIAFWPELYYFSCLKFFDIMGCPAHIIALNAE